MPFIEIFDRVYTFGKLNASGDMWWLTVSIPIVTAIIGFSQAYMMREAPFSPRAALLVILIMTLLLWVSFGLLSVLLARTGRPPLLQITDGPISKMGLVMGGLVLFVLLLAFDVYRYSSLLSYAMLYRALLDMMLALIGTCLSYLGILLARFAVSRTLNPLMVFASSMISVLFLGIIMPDMGLSFLMAFKADPLIATFLAFNLFADSASILETRWILNQR